MRIHKAVKPKELSARFDALFALTHALNSCDYWLNDNEYWTPFAPGRELDKAVKKLADEWKKLLKHTDIELGIDSEFTRPGIESLLDEFSGKCDEVDGVTVKFEWK